MIFEIVTAQEDIDSNCTSLNLDMRSNFFMERVLSIGRACPGRWWSPHPHPWRCSQNHRSGTQCLCGWHDEDGQKLHSLVLQVFSSPNDSTVLFGHPQQTDPTIALINHSATCSCLIRYWYQHLFLQTLIVTPFAFLCMYFDLYM